MQDDTESVESPHVRSSKSRRKRCRIEESVSEILIGHQLGSQSELIKGLLGKDDPLTQIFHDEGVIDDEGCWKEDEEEEMMGPTSCDSRRASAT